TTSGLPIGGEKVVRAPADAAEIEVEYGECPPVHVHVGGTEVTVARSPVEPFGGDSVNALSKSRCYVLEIDPVLALLEEGTDLRERPVDQVAQVKRDPGMPGREIVCRGVQLA